jgi:hypothetical protein
MYNPFAALVTQMDTDDTKFTRLISMDSQYGHRIIELLDSSLFTYLLEIVRGSAVKHLRDEQKD